MGRRRAALASAAQRAQDDYLRTLRAALMLGYATIGRTDDVIAPAARHPLPHDSTPE